MTASKSMIVAIESSKKVNTGNRGLLGGVGLYDADFPSRIVSEGKRYTHPAYTAWANIITRCYVDIPGVNNSTYKNCVISDSWKLFSNFHRWWSVNHVCGWEIDKDLLIPGNKCYSEESCIYIPKSLNEFTTSRQALRGLLPIGVTKDNRCIGLFRARISVDGKQKFIGRFNSPIEAHKAWYRKKVELAYGYKELCENIHPDLFKGLLLKIESLREF